MKKIKLLFTALFCLILSIGVSQPGPPQDKKEQIEAMKVAFITRKLELTPEEAKVFWPIYDQHQNEIQTLRDNRRKAERQARETIDTMSEKDIENVVDGEIVFRQAELDILKKYNPQYKKVLPMKKVAKLYKAEEDFKRELLHKIQQKQTGKPSQNRK